MRAKKKKSKIVDDIKEKKEGISMKQERLKKYAELIAKMGANVQKGQDVIIRAEIDQGPFVRMVTKECYKLGARKVIVEWHDDQLDKLHVRYQSVSSLAHLEKWELEKWAWQANTLPALIYIESSDPDGMKGMNQEKHGKALQKKFPLIKPYRDQMENEYQWTIVAAPSSKWAKKVFPNETKARAMEKLWEAILYTARVDDDPILAWQKHNENLQKHCDYLNSLGLVSLHYKSSNGTDFTVGMIDNALFMGGGETTATSKIYFNPNMPTEECFITPKKGVAEGIVYATKPLSYRGELIENFSIRFHEGKAVEVHAEKGEELLKQMIAMDENAAYLGECALVPFDSPISNSNILFFNTLFDENASCHLALGRGFSNCIRDYNQYSKEDFDKMGVNDSMIHVDFMIGNADLEITGTTKDGKEIAIFHQGNWAF